MGVIKFPRVIVSQHRHHQLLKEARRRKLSISALAEEQFIQATKRK